jgi:1-acyl-sn-glycerol-3-phosphate acyltransferase
MDSLSKYQFAGLENLPKTGGFIAAANHVTDYDALTFTDFLFVNGYKPRVLAKRPLFKIPVVGNLMRSTGMIPVDRGTSKAADSLDAAAELLMQGEVIGIFPEGSLTRDPDHWPMEGKTGAARLALATKVPVIPVGQWGAIDVLARYHKMPKLGKRKLIRFIVGKPVDLSDLYDKPVTSEVLTEATKRIMDAISALVSELRGEPAPMPRFDLRKHPEYRRKMKNYPPISRP